MLLAKAKCAGYAKILLPQVMYCLIQYIKEKPQR